MIAAGILGGLISSIFGLVDWLAIPPRTRAKNIGLWHGAGNIVVILLFSSGWLLRRPMPENPRACICLLVSGRNSRTANGVARRRVGGQVGRGGRSGSPFECSKFSIWSSCQRPYSKTRSLMPFLPFWSRTGTGRSERVRISNSRIHS